MWELSSVPAQRESLSKARRRDGVCDMWECPAVTRGCWRGAALQAIPLQHVGLPEQALAVPGEC